MKIKLDRDVQDTQQDNKIIKAGTTIERDEKRGKDFFKYGTEVKEEPKKKTLKKKE